MTNLNYKHLRYFWMVAKAGSIARASEHPVITAICRFAQHDVFGGAVEQKSK